MRILVQCKLHQSPTRPSGQGGTAESADAEMVKADVRPATSEGMVRKPSRPLSALASGELRCARVSILQPQTTVLLTLFHLLDQAIESFLPWTPCISSELMPPLLLTNDL